MNQETPETNYWEFRTIASPVDSEAIRYAIWQRHQQCDRVFVFLNGRSEWIEKYDFLPQELGLKENVAFVTMDHRGQGASGGVRAHVDTYDSFAADVAAVLADAVGNKPFVILGHSMGGLIATYTTLLKKIEPLAIALSSPLFCLPAKPVPHAIARPVTALLQRFGYGTIATGAGGHGRDDFTANPLTHDFTAYRKIRSSPYPSSSPTHGWVAATFRATKEIFRPDLLREFVTPILVLAGSDERVVDPRAFSQWVRTAAHATDSPVQYDLIPDLRHELLNETIERRRAAIAKVRLFFRVHAEGFFAD